MPFQLCVAQSSGKCEELNTRLKVVEQATWNTSQLKSVSDLLLVLLLKFIDNHYAIAIIRIIYIYLHFITVYVSLYLFTYLFSTALTNLQTG